MRFLPLFSLGLMVVFAGGGPSTEYLWTLARVWWGGLRTWSRHGLQPLRSGLHPPAKAERAGEVSLHKKGLRASGSSERTGSLPPAPGGPVLVLGGHVHMLERAFCRAMVHLL